MTSNWAQKMGVGADVGSMSIEALKDELPLQYVINDAGVALNSVGERLVGLCPFHEDSNPSFAVWGDNLEACGCWSCDFSQGDFLDFLQKRNSWEFNDALKYARNLLIQFREDPSWVPLEVEESEPGDPAHFASVMMDAYNEYDRNPHALQQLVLDKGLDIDPAWIHDAWWVGTRGDHEIVIPHADETSPQPVITGYKTRYEGGHPYAVTGSRFPAMYGAWRSQDHDIVIICEGESDTWWTSWVFRNQKVDVFGVPTGANTPCRAEWQEQLDGKDVVLLGDADRSGRLMAQRWSSALVSKARSIHVAVLPDGYDACKLNSKLLQKAVADALLVEQFPVAVAEQSGGYIRTSNGVRITDWVFQPDRFLKLTDGFGFEGVVSGRYQRTTLSFLDLSTRARLKAWCARNERFFFGTDRDIDHIGKLLELKRPFLAHGRGVSQVGWHDGAFVLPNRIIGVSDARYVRGDVTDDLSDFVGIGKMKVADPAQLLPWLLRLHEPGLVKPLMAWTAVSALRSLCVEFPVFNVMGGSGAGKTSLVRAIMWAFGYNGRPNNITSTTPYAIGQMMASSNGVPVWVDEYRLGAKRETKERMNQIVRDAWDGSSSKRGGQSENLSKVVSTPASAPLLVGGEDVFEETSLRERTVRIRVPRESALKSPEALKAVMSAGELGGAWLQWLTDEWAVGGFGVPEFDVLDREHTSRQVLEWGWSLLSRWAESSYGVDLGEFELQDPSDRDEGALVDIDPVLEMLVWGLDEVDGQYRPLVWMEDEALLVRVRELVNAAKKGGFILPGGERATADWLMEWAGGGGRRRSKEGWALVLARGSAQKLKGVVEALSEKPAED